MRFGAVEVNRPPRAAATRRLGVAADRGGHLEELTMCKAAAPAINGKDAGGAGLFFCVHPRPKPTPRPKE